MEKQPADLEEGVLSSIQQDSASVQWRAETFFSTPELRQRLDLLRHLTDNSEKILLIKGVFGSGKTTLLQRYRRLSREEWMVCCLNADHMLQPDQFFSSLFRRFGLNGPETLNLDGLLKRFEMLQAAGRLPVIVIDDAHLLPVATLIALFRLFERRPGNRALIRVLLFAEPEITSQLQTPQLQAMNLQSIQSLEMPLFDTAQARAFLAFLLDAGGSSQGLQLASGRIERIVKDAAGVPGLMEAQLQHIFADMPTEEAPVVAGSSGEKGPGIRAMLTDLPLSVLAGAPLLLVVLLLTLIFQDQINQLFGQSEPEATDGAAVMLREGGLRPLKLPEQDRRVAVEEAGPPTFEAAPLADTPVEGLALPEVVLQVPEALPPPVVAEPEGGVDVAPVYPDATLPAEPLLGNEPATASGDLPSVTDAEPPSEKDLVSSVILESDTVAEEATEPTTTGRPEGEEQESPVEAVVEAGVKDEKWILTRNPGAYTLQLLGVRNEASAKRFIKQHRLKGDVSYFKTIRSGQPWFAVIYGVYPDRAAALRGQETLPSELRKNDAWPRTYASIQALVGK